MKTLKDIVSESLLDDEDDIMNIGVDKIRESIREWIFENYRVVKSSVKVLKRLNADGKFVVNADHAIFESKSDSLTNGLFVWGKIKNQFVCSRSNIRTLEGAPKEVGGEFFCNRCECLTSLEGMPEKIGADVYCSDCGSLKSLKGAPKYVPGDFRCTDNMKLSSLKYMPEKISGDFLCYRCKSDFTEDYVRSLSTIEGKIVL